MEVDVSVPPLPAQPALLRQAEEVEVVRVPEAEEHSNHVTVEAAPAEPAQPSVLPPGVSREELAAIKIQTAFRGYLVMWIQLFWNAIFFLDMFRIGICFCWLQSWFDLCDFAGERIVLFFFVPRQHDWTCKQMSVGVYPENFLKLLGVSSLPTLQRVAGQLLLF
jgi:hypothetical protein